MTINQFLELVKKDYLFMVIGFIIVVAGVFAYNQKTETTYEGAVGFSIVRFGKEANSEFNDYYATQADNLVTANFVKWLSSKAFIANVYKEAGQDLDKTNIDAEVRSVKATKVSGTDIDFIFKSTSREVATAIGNATIKLVNERSVQIKKENPKDGNLRGLEVSSKLKVYQQNTNQGLNYLLALVVGLLLGIIAILIKNYLTSQKK